MKQSASLLAALILASAATVPATAHGAKSFTATVNYTGATAQNIPVLLRISEAGINGFDYGDVTASDLEILDENENPLPYEIDTWDTAGESTVWVLLPVYEDGATVTVRYGDAFTNAPLPSTDVWADYVGVWHLGAFDASAGTYGVYSNSTATAGIDGEKSAAAIANEAGVVGKSVKVCDAGAHTGNYKYGGVFVPDSGANSPLDLGDTFAISGWFKHKDQDYYYDKLFFKRKKSDNSSSPNGSFAIEVAGPQTSTATLSVRGSSSSNFTATPASLKNWTHLTFVYDGTTCSIYQNGVLLQSGAVAAVTDNDAPLCFGCASAGYLDQQGEACWCGWMDEVRLTDGVPTADWLAAEYHAMSSALSYGAVASSDTSAPVLGTPTVARNQNGSFAISVEVSENLPATIVCEIGGTDYPMTTSDASVPATYSVTVSNLVAGTYVAVVRATGTGGTTVSATCPTAFHSGALTVSKVSDADEGTVAPGVFRVSRLDADASTAPALPFNVAFSGDGLAAVAVSGISSATIPAGAASVDISVTPVPAPSIDEDADLTLTVSGANIGQASSATLTVLNAAFDLAVRYVAEDGNDANHGGTPALPKKTIAAAVAAVDVLARTQPCTIHVAAGSYPVDAPVVVTNAIRIVGEGAAPSAVVVSNAAVGASANDDVRRIFEVNHPGAFVSGLTMANGRIRLGQGNKGGGGVLLGAGTVSNCVIHSSGIEQTGSSYALGGAVHMTGSSALLTHCVVSNCTAKSSEADWVTYPGCAGVFASAGSIENCLVADCRDDRDGRDESHLPAKEKMVGGIMLRGETARAVNCTVVNCHGSAGGGVYVAHAQSSEKNSVAFGCEKRILADGAEQISSVPAPFLGTATLFDHCASDAEDTYDANDSILRISSAAFKNYANGDYRPAPGGPLVGAGANYEGMAAVDLSGKQKRLIGKQIDIGAYEANAANTLFIMK